MITRACKSLVDAAEPSPSDRGRLNQYRTSDSQSSVHISLDRLERGAALIELAIVLPFLFVLFFGATELVRYIGTYQRLSVLSKEAANLVFRECIELDDDNARDCLQRVRNTMNGTQSSVLPNTTFILTILREPPSGIGAIQVLKEPPTDPPPHVSKFGSATAPAFRPGFVARARRVAVAEVFHVYDPIFDYRWVGISYDMYDWTVY